MESMSLKFEGRSRKVNCLTFHPTKPWILCGLDEGEIKLWNYSDGDWIQCFRMHEGAVRGLDFHKSVQVFASGGEDAKIRGWSFETKGLIFTLLGHLGLIRTVQFHNKHPWIVSASDDMTLMIWNWESETCLSILAGHESPVNSASFHPKEDLVVSASMDRTVRLWDIGALRNEHIVSPAHVVSRMGQLYGALFNGSDVIVLQGHLAGVNWASFHPTLPLIVSGADDHQLNLWSIKGETRTWEMDTLGVHMDNVSCVMFLPNTPHRLVSTSEDGSIRVWDTTNRTELHTFHRENDRYCSLAVHPDRNLLAAGHDSGTMVFKLPREGPAFALNSDFLFDFKDGFLWCYDFSVKTARSRVFIDRKLFAVLDKSTNQVTVMNLNNQEVYKRTLPMPADAIFYARTGILLCRSEDKVFIFDLEEKLLLGELETPEIVRYIVWSTDKENVALLTQHTIIIASKYLVRRYTLNETTDVESGAWDDNGVFVYTTLNHVKYYCVNGNSGIIRTLEVPIYIAKVEGNSIFCLDVNGDSMIIAIDDAEYDDGVAAEENEENDDEWEFGSIDVEGINRMRWYQMEVVNEEGMDNHGNGWELLNFREMENIEHLRRRRRQRRMQEEARRRGDTLIRRIRELTRRGFM